MNTSEILNTAADLIEERGWGHADGWFPEGDGPLCAEGAIRLAAGTTKKVEVCGVLGNYLADIHPEMPRSTVHGGVIVFWWNDTPGMTASDVIEAIRACAVIEASREHEPVLA